MMLSGCSLILGLFLFSTAVDARSDETLIMKIFNPDYRPSAVQLEAMLKKANLERHGYKKEVTTSVVNDPGSDKTKLEKKYLYYKIVNCSRAQEISQELQTLFSDAFGVEMIEKVNKEIKARNLTNMHQCKVGLEVHFKDGNGCITKKNKSLRSKRARARRGFFSCWFCKGCVVVEAK